MSQRGWVIAAVLMIGACTSSPPPAKDSARLLDPLGVQFRYEARTAFPNGGAGRGDVILAPREDIYNVLWQADDVQSWTGIAREADGLLGMATLRFPREYPRDGDILGLAVYRIKGGDLIGSRVEEHGQVRIRRSEHLRGPATLNGRYEIVDPDSRAPDYVKFTPNGATFLVGWIDPPFTMYGVGIRVGETLFVGYSNRILPAVTVVCQSGVELKGVGATGSRPTLSFVRMTPKGVAPPPDNPGSPCLRLLETVRRS